MVWQCMKLEYLQTWQLRWTDYSEQQEIAWWQQDFQCQIADISEHFKFVSDQGITHIRDGHKNLAAMSHI